LTVLEVKKQIIQKTGAIKGNGFEITLQNIDRVLLREKQGDDKLT
jgi:CO dehydrogenase/acetyl-CoA synthase delta subunit